MKPYKTGRIISNKFSSIFQKSRTEFDDDKKVYINDQAVNTLNNMLISKEFSFLSLSHYEVNLLHEYLKMQAKGRGDYSKRVYLPEDYRVNSIIGTLSKSSLDHVCHQYLKDLENVKVLNFLTYGAEERMLLKSADEKIAFTCLPEKYLDRSSLLEHLEGKRVLVLSSFSELIKIQHLNQKYLHPDHSKLSGDFEILTIDIEKLYQEKEAYSLFEKLDALKIEILKYYFDVALINLAVLNLPVVSFISSLHRNSIALGDDIYKVFGIAKDSAEKSGHDNHWVDLHSYRQGNEDTFLATGVIGAPIVMKKPKRGKHVH